MKAPKNIDEPAKRFWELLDTAQRADWLMYKTYALPMFRERFKTRFRVRLELHRKKFKP